jgi:hypothetical protein
LASAALDRHRFGENSGPVAFSVQVEQAAAADRAAAELAAVTVADVGGESRFLSLTRILHGDSRFVTGFTAQTMNSIETLSGIASTSEFLPTSSSPVSQSSPTYPPA